MIDDEWLMGRPDSWSDEYRQEVHDVIDEMDRQFDAQPEWFKQMKVSDFENDLVNPEAEIMSWES